MPEKRPGTRAYELLRIVDAPPLAGIGVYPYRMPMYGDRILVLTPELGHALPQGYRSGKGALTAAADRGLFRIGA